MIQFPPEVFINRLTRGTVIKFPHLDFPQKPHYFVILNINPLRDGFFLSVTNNRSLTLLDKSRDFCRDPQNSRIGFSFCSRLLFLKRILVKNVKLGVDIMDWVFRISS